MKLLIAGDMIPLRRDTDCHWSDLLSTQDIVHLREHDIFYLNLEIPLVENIDGVPKLGPILGGDPSSIELLKRIDVDVVNLANNHINDFGRSGIKATIDLLCRADIGWFGAGANFQEAGYHFKIECGGMKIGFIGFAEQHYSDTIDGEFVVNPFYTGTVLSEVKRVISECDIAVVVINQGLEWVPWPSPATQFICHRLIESGASIVVNHQPHLPRGFEEYRKGLIIYGAGSFYTPYFDSWKDRRHFDWGLLFSLGVSENSVKIIDVETVEIRRDGHLTLQTLKSNEDRERYLSLCNAPLNDVCLLNAIWQEVSVRLYENEYCDWLGWNERDRLYPLKEWGKRLFLACKFNSYEVQSRVKQRFMRRWELLGTHSNQEVIVTALDVLCGHAKDLRCSESKRIVQEMMPWIF